MTGVVKHAQGQPEPGVEGCANNTVYSDTDARGCYRMELPHDIGTWRPGATLERDFHGERFRMTLSPNDRAAFRGSVGAGRDFTWKLSGPHGGGVRPEHMNVSCGNGTAYGYGNLIVTLTPRAR